ncbi:rRNA maturation RNase YbeY [Cohnella rhizosphaerae]|uniref:Endoribonuclease YbeY n=1 Tax=Cohnella rhizosphaerae TaxID=1457232 RepID=A0A9X4KWM8_9BACL|nr:rRNA maturation RNase YbeY [Cohnella rhizosphaerae]MDG0812148.1 rRNA maturation RNase YbeY [Cohnella rhizosphaerae]
MSLKLEWVDEREAVSAGEAGWPSLLTRLLDEAAKAEGVASGIVTLTLTDNEGIRELNRTYRGLDKTTDVLSFPMREQGAEEFEILYDDDYETTTVDILNAEAEDEETPDAELGTVAGRIEELLGDIVISVPRMHEQAVEYGHSAERELGFLFVHGFLHLMGYDHGTEEEERAMFAKQEAVLARAGLTR